MQFPINIELQRSALLLFLLVVVHALAAASVIALPWAPAWRLALLALVGGSLAGALRRSRIVGLRLVARDRLECVLADGRRVAAQTLPDSAVFARMAVLRLRLGDEKRVSRLVVLADQLSGDEFRRLRLWLRWQAAPTKARGSAGSAS